MQFYSFIYCVLKTQKSEWDNREIYLRAIPSGINSEYVEGVYCGGGIMFYCMASDVCVLW